MAICPVCNKEIGFFDAIKVDIEKNISVHTKCVSEYQNMKEDKDHVKEDKDRVDDESQSTSATNTPNITTPNASNSKVQVTNFDMPFEDMIKFMVKWALASIPAFIILFIIFGILFAIFGTLFF